MASYLSWLRVPFLASSGIAALASGLLYWNQNEIIYPRNFPLGARTDEGVPRPNQFGITDYEDLRIPTPDGEMLSAFFIRPSNKRQAKKLTILMFHGNAGNIGHRVPIAKVLQEHIGCNVFMLEYRGYGLSTGTPDEKGINVDAQTALDYVRSQGETRDDKIIVYGESIGGACAIRLVADNQETGAIAGLILVNTFTSIKKLIPTIFPAARFIAGLCHQYWNSEQDLPRISEIPMIFLSGLKDEIVPPSHMKELYSICKTKRKIWRDFPNGTHNETIAQPYFFDYVDQFPSSAGASSAEHSAAENSASNSGRGGASNRRRGAGGGRRGITAGRGRSGTDRPATNGASNAASVQVPPVSTIARQLPATRQFRGRLTTQVESTDPQDIASSTLSASATEFLPGQQQHKPRANRGRGGKNGPSTQHPAQNSHVNRRRDSGLKSTAPDIATRTHDDITHGLVEMFARESIIVEIMTAKRAVTLKTPSLPIVLDLQTSSVIVHVARLPSKTSLEQRGSVAQILFQTVTSSALSHLLAGTLVSKSATQIRVCPAF
ncbi:MAG: hypothetical protein Q9220_002436 [cf. Caloplaca sp. 1 TL-2023]